jgi:ATP-dependent Lhr-like helicase
MSSITDRFSLGPAVVGELLKQLVAKGLLTTGALRPMELGGVGQEWADPKVLRRIRRRTLAALRREVEPVDPEALGVFLPHWQQVGPWAIGRGRDGLLRAVEQLAGYPVPASALESLVLPARVVDYQPDLLDEALTSGEVIWAGHGRLPGSGGGDGMVSLHLAEDAPWTLRSPPVKSPEAEQQPLAEQILELLTGSGGYFLPQLAQRAGASQSATLAALWDLVWAGLVTNDTLTPLREAVGLGVGGAHRARSQPARGRAVRPGRFAAYSQAVTNSNVVKTGGGRWSALPLRDSDPTRRAHALAQILLDRHGVVTRAVAQSEEASGEFSRVYQVFRELEDRGKIRRGYFVEGLGGAQFAVPGAVDLLRSDDADRTAPVAEPGYGLSSDTVPTSVSRSHPVGAPIQKPLLLAATDPANPYGAALPWPGSRQLETSRATPKDRDHNQPGETPGHRPGRKAGAVVVLQGGALKLYLERGGKSLLTFEDSHSTAESSDAPPEQSMGAPPVTQSPPPGMQADLASALATLVEAARAGKLGKVTINKINGLPALTHIKNKSPIANLLLEAGFIVTPNGLKIGKPKEPERPEYRKYQAVTKPR